MQLRKVKFLLLALAVVSGLFFAGAEAHAVTFSYDMTLESITSADFTKSATYTYNFSQGSGSSTLSYVDFEIPAEISIPVGAFSGSTTKFSVTANGVTLGGEVYDIGIGDYGTKFGVGDTRYRVMKVNIPNPSGNFKVVLTLRGQTFSSGRRFGAAGQSDFGVVLIKAGNGSNTQTFVIQTPTVVGPPVTPAPVFTGMSVFPNPVVVGNCATATWTVSDPAATFTVSPEPASISGNQATICPSAPGTTTYTVTAIGAGGPATTSFSVTGVNATPPPPAFNSVTVFPNPIVVPGECATVRWVLSEPSAAVTIDDPSLQVTGSETSVCLDTPGVATYTITATGAGGSSTASFSVTGVSVPPPPPVISLSILPNPVTPPGCATIRWDSSDPAAIVTITGDFVQMSTDPDDPAYAKVCLLENVAPGIYTYTATAAGSTGTSTATFTLTVSEPPLIQTTCKQIVKRPASGSPSCIYLCLNTINGLQQDIASATWYPNETCTGSGYALDIWGEADTDEKTLICAPCRYPGVDAGDPQACTDNTSDTVTPFRMNFKGQFKNCDVFRYSRQDQGFSAVLGTDPWVVVNGKAVWTR